MSYGNLKFDAANGLWSITKMAPHVAIAFKRMFPKVHKGSVNPILTDTDDTRADLHWFMQRYPFDHDEQARLDEGVCRMQHRIAERGRILLPTWEPGEIIGFREGLQPYMYQAQAATITIANPNLLLGDDVGLGKTISAIATCANGAPLPAAIVVQPHLAFQWKSQVEKFSTLTAHIIIGTRPYDLPKADVYIFCYSNVLGWIDIIDSGIFRTAIWDEIQELRHGMETAKGEACAVLSMHAELRQGLTATPVYNYGDEIFTVMSYIQPGVLGDKAEFSREWCGYSKRVQDPDALGAFLKESGFFLRRTEHDEAVSASLPPLNVIDIQVPFDERAMADEEALLRTLAMTVMNGSFVERGNAAREMDARLRQITGIAKAKSVAAYVKLLLKDSPRVLIAGWHREVYSIWRSELARFNPVMYSGSESAAGKRGSVERFTKGDSRVMMISLRSGAGLDGLQHNCHDVVHGEFDWSPQVHYQINGRLRRPGQLGQVNAHYVHANGGSDPVLMETIGVKADQARGILDPGQAPAIKYSDDSRVKRLAQHVLKHGI